MFLHPHHLQELILVRRRPLRRYSVIPGISMDLDVAFVSAFVMCLLPTAR